LVWVRFSVRVRVRFRFRVSVRVSTRASTIVRIRTMPGLGLRYLFFVLSLGLIL
jgi:hypothetical protein